MTADANAPRRGRTAAPCLPQAPSAWLRARAEEPWLIGWNDCLGIVGRWVSLVARVDLSGLTPPAGDAAGCRAWLDSHGGMAAAMARVAGRIGLAAVDGPELGDVAHLVVTGAEEVESAAIWIGSAWGMRTTAGLALVRPAHVRATVWSIRSIRHGA